MTIANIVTLSALQAELSEEVFNTLLEQVGFTAEQFEEAKAAA